MDFRDDVELDASEIEDRGSGGGESGDDSGRNAGGDGDDDEGGGISFGGGALAIVGVVVVIAGAVFGFDPLGMFDGGSDAKPATSAALSKECKTGKDADESQKCRAVGVVNSLQTYWRQAFVERGKKPYKTAKTVLFTGSTKSPCGKASADTGPFYCPTDRKVYLDLAFFTELKRDFGAKGGPFAEAYVIAHEYGHHAQNLMGTFDDTADDEGAKSDSVRVELQADCYAGVWANNAVETGFYEDPFTATDIKLALDAAAAIGDDKIQKLSDEAVDSDSWTHGSSAQRVKWFTKGYKSGSPAKCDTFSGGI